MPRHQLSALGKRSDDQRGRRQGEAQADYQRRFPREPERDGGQREQRAGYADLRAAETEYRAAQRPQPRGIEFEPDQEQEEHHADFRELQRRLGGAYDAESPRTDQHAGGEITQDGAEFQALKQRHKQHRG